MEGNGGMVVKLERRGAAGRARAMGRRAGEDLRTLGLPSRCPFRRPELAAAWRRGYVAGLSGGRR